MGCDPRFGNHCSNYWKLPWLFALVTHAGGRLKEGWHAAAISWRHCYAWVMNRSFLFLAFQQWQSHHSQDRGLQQQGHPGECRLCLSSDDRWFFCLISLPFQTFGCFTSCPDPDYFKHANTCPERVLKCHLVFFMRSLLESYLS